MKKVILALLVSLVIILAPNVAPKAQAATPAFNFTLPQGAKIKVASSVDNNTHKLNLTFTNVIFARKIDYTLTYMHAGLQEGIQGSFTNYSLFPIHKSILLGTCSTGGACVYHTGISDMKLQVKTNYILFDLNDIVNYNIL